MPKRKVPVDLQQLAASLVNKDSGVFEELVTLARHYTIGFVSIPDAPTDHPWPSGTATLVAVGGTHYFLTAEHVWRNLQRFKNVGVTLVPNIDQCFTILTQHLIPTGPRKPSAAMDGPDLVLLKIPGVKLGEIKARKSFYQLDLPARKPQVQASCLEVAILLGAPGEAAKLIAQNNLDMTIQGIMADPKPKTFTNGRYDYIDLKEFFGVHGFPTSYGGFSGGGLWRVHVYLDPETRVRKEQIRLAGMAFYEFPAKRRYRVIRCHGARSIDVLKRMLRAKTPGKSRQIVLA
jgi:hypothetical protein